MAVVRRALAAACAVVALGCGPGLVDARYDGEPRLTLRGSTSPAPQEFEAYRKQLRLSLFYVGKKLTTARTLDDLVEQEATGQAVELPWSFDWTLYDEPEPQHFTTPDFALGVPILYADVNGNHRRDPAEPMVGQAGGTGVAFARRALSAEESPTRRPVPATFGLVAKPIPCTPLPPLPPGPTDCGVPLGAPCTSDAACGAGTCLVSEPWPWPAGYCALPLTMGGCVPKAGSPWRSHLGTLASYWVQRCETHADCRDPYLCDPLQHACLPIGNVGLRISTETRLTFLCAPTMQMPGPPP